MNRDTVDKLKNGVILKFSKTCEIFGSRTCSIQVDDPEYDLVNPHPAFTRGHDFMDNFLTRQAYLALGVSDSSTKDDFVDLIRDLRKERDQLKNQVISLSDHIEELNLSY